MVTTKLRFAGHNDTTGTRPRQPVKCISVETTADFRGQRIVGGNVALDLLNTQNGPAGGAPDEDVLAGYADFLAWAAHVGLLSTDEERRLRRRARERPAEADAVFTRVRETRAYLHDIFAAIAGGASPTSADLATLQRDAADALAHGTLASDDDHYRWTWIGDQDLALPLWPIIHAAATLATSGPLDRVKGCASCRFLFIDESKNRSRRWCSMDDCGAQDKMRKYVARRASVRASRKAT